MWNFEVRKTADSTAKAPRVAVAGPLISSVSREKLDLGDPPIVKIDTPDQAREFVRKLVAQKPDLVKIWYIVDQDHPVDSFRPIVRATIEESHAHKIRVAVHATELETARAAVEEGADVLVHSVIDKPVDDATIIVRISVELSLPVLVGMQQSIAISSQLGQHEIRRALGSYCIARFGQHLRRLGEGRDHQSVPTGEDLFIAPRPDAF